MKIGVLLPQGELGTSPSAIREFAVGVEASGFDYLLAYDHVLGADPGHHQLSGPYTHESSFHEPLTLFSHLAACTSRIQFITGVLILPQRQTALVAKQAVEVDILSEGRLTLGVGVGWNQVEYSALGVPFDRRGDRLEEQVKVLRRLWQEPLISFSGLFHQLEQTGINPRPPSDMIPIWIGGWADRVLDRTGRLADGWLAFPAHPSMRERTVGRIWEPDDLEEPLNRVRKSAVDAGRDPSAISVCVLHYPDDRAAQSPDWMVAWATAGATHCTIGLTDVGAFPPAHLALLRRLAESLRPEDRVRRVRPLQRVQRRHELPTLGRSPHDG